MSSWLFNKLAHRQMHVLLCTNVNSDVYPTNDDPRDVVGFDVKHRRVEEGKVLDGQVVRLVRKNVPGLREVSVSSRKGFPSPLVT
eukprot:5836436-Pyramimonas_sp.AAC.1